MTLFRIYNANKKALRAFSQDFEHQHDWKLVDNRYYDLYKGPQYFQHHVDLKFMMVQILTHLHRFAPNANITVFEQLGHGNVPEGYIRWSVQSKKLKISSDQMYKFDTLTVDCKLWSSHKTDPQGAENETFEELKKYFGDKDTKIYPVVPKDEMDGALSFVLNHPMGRVYRFSSVENKEPLKVAEKYVAVAN